MKKVAYLYNDAITNYHFSKEHPLKTKRIKMTHSLIQNYQLNNYITMYQSKEASKDQILSFHHPQYVNYLQSWVTGKKGQIVIHFNSQDRKKMRQNTKFTSQFKINQSFDCPGFEGLYNYCQLAVGGSVDAADIILSGLSHIAINWAGGHHHAKKSEASGFCYVNDIVICILQLLKTYPRVLYLDIDVHHGDGVQEAFYHTNRVMTVSFHQYGQDFFPGTGSLQSVGDGIGKYFTVNVPLKKGIDDITYANLFKRIISSVMASFRPDCCVIQCGADSLSKDRLGNLNLSIQGHSQCIKHMLSYNVPLVILGGGGYTVENVARCWVYETAALVGVQIDNKIPQKDQFYQLYRESDHKLHFQVEERVNENTPEYLDNLYKNIVENLRKSELRPSVAFHNIPQHFLEEEQMNWVKIGEQEDSFDDQLCNEVFNKLHR